MSKTLKLAERLLALGQRLYDFGLFPQATRIFKRLAALPDLPSDIAQEAQHSLADIYIRCESYGRARRHLAVAIQHEPDNPRSFYLMAAATEADVRCDAKRALQYYKRALKLDPEQPHCLADCGLLALRMGLARTGLTALRTALRLAPNDPELVGKVAKGLCDEGRISEAQNALQAALFRNPRDGRFRKLWNDLRFQIARIEQQRFKTVDTDGPTILPFLRPAVAKKSVSLDGMILRHDGPERAPRLPHHLRVPGKRHA